MSRLGRSRVAGSRAMPNNQRMENLIHFGCTQCGKCCRDTKVPLTVAEAIKWLNRGDEVQLLCEASPWPEALDGEPRAAHFKGRSFAVMNPLVALEPANKACPPEAWAKDQPLLQRGRVLTDNTISRDIEMSRAADVLDAGVKSRLCLALNVAHTAMVHEAVLVYSPTPQTLLSALSVATAMDVSQEPAAQWRFVSDQPETLDTLAQSGGIALHLRDAEAASFQYLGFKRQAIFGIHAGA